MFISNNNCIANYNYFTIMKKLINYLFPNDWYDVETINVTHHSSLTGTPEILGKRIIIQKSPSTGRYRKQVINIYP